MILITEFMDGAAVDKLREQFALAYEPDLADKQADIPSKLSTTEALIVRNRTKVTAALLDSAPKLQCVGRLGVGLDNIDLDACAKRGIKVYPASGANDLSVAEYVITTAMVLLRHAYQAGDLVIDGAWPRQACVGREISGKTLGLVGYGSVARHVAKYARALGMNVCAYDPFLPVDDPAWGETVSMELGALLSACDVVSLHTPLTPGTRHLINAEQLALMKIDAVLINTARGGVVDEEALVVALKSGKLAGAALDVHETEPVTYASGNKFSNLKNLWLTPHIAGVTQESNVRVSAMIAEKIARHLNRTT